MASQDVNERGAWRVATLMLAVLMLAVLLLPPPVLAGPVNVNSADAATLARELQGIGDSKAAAIVAHRDKHGPFRSVDDLARVKGIGRKTLDRNRDFIRLDGRAPPPRAAGAAGSSSGSAAGSSSGSSPGAPTTATKGSSARAGGASPAPSLPRTVQRASPPAPQGDRSR